MNKGINMTSVTDIFATLASLTSEDLERVIDAARFELLDRESKEYTKRDYDDKRTPGAPEDAHLIAAAPEMFKVLRLVRNQYLLHPAVREIVKAVIAKATPVAIANNA